MNTKRIVLIMPFIFITTTLFADTLIRNNFEKCDPFFDSLAEGMNECVGSKCKSVWVYSASPDDITAQTGNYQEIQLPKFEAEFWARYELALHLNSSISVETKIINGKEIEYTKGQTNIDLFEDLKFEKKFFCYPEKVKLDSIKPLFETVIKFIGVVEKDY
jgi:hypothetical protein